MDAKEVLTGAALERMFEWQRRSLIQGDESRMLLSETIAISGHPGRYYKARTEGDYVADEQLCLVNKRLSYCWSFMKKAVRKTM